MLLDTLPLLGLCVIPLAIALQSLVAGLIVCCGAWIFYRDHSFNLNAREIGFILINFLFFVVTILATISNPKLSNEPLLQFAFGQLLWMFAPLFAKTWFKNKQTFLKEDPRQLLFRLGSFVSLFILLITVSQMLFPWRLDGIEFVKDIPRPRGFFSHPLTFAYVALVFWPLAVHLVMNHYRTIKTWAIFLGVLTIIIVTVSRTVQILAIVFLLYNLWTRGSKRLRSFSFAGVAMALILVFSTPNKISDKFVRTFSGEGVDKQSSYFDDRLAFWDAHWQMIKEKPFIGHGIYIDSQYRTPYYEMIGLGDFGKKYEAHNQFIQTTTETGIIGLLLWLSSFAMIIDLAVRDSSPTLRKLVIQTTTIFLLSCLTQNAFEDAEVRFALTILAILFFNLKQVMPRAEPEPEPVIEPLNSVKLSTRTTSTRVSQEPIYSESQT